MRGAGTARARDKQSKTIEELINQSANRRGTPARERDRSRRGVRDRSRQGTHCAGICTSKTSKHSPHWTEVIACLSTACSSALQDGHENWYVDVSPIGE